MSTIRWLAGWLTTYNKRRRIALMAFKDALAREMRRGGFTKSGLANAVRVDRSAVTRWTDGSTEPSARVYARLVKVLPKLRTVFYD